MTLIGLKNLALKYKRLIKYLISGGCAAVVSIGSFSLLVGFFHIWYIAASVISFIVSFGISFGLQKFWTFGDTSTEGIQKQAAIYLTVALANLCLTVALMYVLVDVVYPPLLQTIVSATYWKIISQIMVNGFIAIASFFIYRKIFRL